MLKMVLIYSHLLGTCLALGMMAMTDLRLLARVVGYRVIIPPPKPFELRVITTALGLLLATGAMLVILGQQENPNYLLHNEKLQAKIAIVGLLCLNALVLHFGVFHHLSKYRPVALWSNGQRNGVALSVGLSNSMWLYCAFLGIARAWNQGMTRVDVLLIALGLFVAMTCGARLVLEIASRRECAEGGDWVDKLKRVLHDLTQRHPEFAETEVLLRRPAGGLKRVY